MKENFLTSMLMEGGKISHKRWISVTVSGAITFGILWTVVHYKDLINPLLNSAMIFVCVMSGVATVAQIVSLVTRTPAPKEDPSPPTTTITTTTETKTEP